MSEQQVPPGAAGNGMLKDNDPAADYIAHLQATIAQQQATIDAYKLAGEHDAERYIKATVKIDQQQARIEEEHAAALQVWESLSEAQQALAAERERAEALRAEVDEQEREIRHWAGRNSDLLAELQAEREKSAALHQRFAEAVQAKERLEALAGLATRDALATQAPEAGQ